MSKAKNKIIFYYFIIEKLFTVTIQDSFCLSRSQIDELLTLFDSSPKIVNTSELIKINRAISYLTFILKDVKEFVSIKHNEEVYLEELRYASKRIKELKQEYYMN